MNNFTYLHCSGVWGVAFIANISETDDQRPTIHYYPMGCHYNSTNNSDMGEY